MNVLRHLHPDCIELALGFAPAEPAPDESEAQAAKRLARDKERLVGAFAGLMDRSGRVVSVPKFARDLDHRERKATTGIAPGIALPHVRSMQVREFVMGYVRAPEPGWPWQALDGEPVRHFFILASPPWDDRLYLQVYRELAELLQDEDTMEALLEAATVQDVMNAFRHYFVR